MLETVERPGVEELRYPKPESFEGYGYGDLNEQELRCLSDNLPVDDEDWFEINNACAAIELGLDSL